MAWQPKWRNGRRAGLKIRSTQVGVGSSPTFGSIQRKDLRRTKGNGFQRGKSHFTKFHKNRPQTKKGRLTCLPLLPTGPFACSDPAPLLLTRGAFTKMRAIKKQATKPALDSPCPPNPLLTDHPWQAERRVPQRAANPCRPLQPLACVRELIAVSPCVRTGSTLRAAGWPEFGNRCGCSFARASA